MPPKTEKLQKQTSHTHLNHGRILIVCEGRETEFNYFNGFKQALHRFWKSKADDVIVLDIKSAESKTTANQIIERAEKEKASATLDYLEIWCVFDKDNDTQNSPGDYNEIIDTRAKSKGLRVAYSNPAFELWYLLHFCYHHVELQYDSCCEKELTRYLKEEYKKSDPKLFDKVKEKQAIAIKNAKRLMEKWEGRTDFANHNPSTTVHELVTMLNDYLKKVENAV